MNIPGSICLPNGDLAYRIESILEDKSRPIVVHCAGRTRSIIGAQTLRNLGIENPVFALENGTQGWMLSGLALEHGSTRRAENDPDKAQKAALRERSRSCLQKASHPWLTLCIIVSFARRSASAWPCLPRDRT